VRLLAVATFGAVLLMGCSETDYVLGGTPEGAAGAPNDGGGSGATTATGGLGTFSIPTLVPGLNLPYSTDDDPSLTANQLEIYFNSDRPGGVSGFDIWRATRDSIDDPWGPPEVVPELSSVGTETRASVEPDGLTIWITTRGFGASAGYDIWVSRRATTEDEWSQMEFVAELSSAEDDMATAPGADFGDVYLARRPVGTEAWDMFRFEVTDTGFGPAVPLDEFNTPGSESDPFVTGDGLSMFFTNQTFGTAGDDIYVAHRTALELPFGQEFPVFELNTQWNDADLWVSPDLRSAFFASNRNGGVWNIYEAHR
jgi:hypothetical protein